MPPPRSDTILLMQPGRFGDMVLTTPLFRALREIFPLGRITVVASPGPALLARNDPDVDDVIVLGSGFARLIASLPRLRSSSYTLFIDPKDHTSSTSRIVARTVRGERKLLTDTNAPRGADVIASAQGRARHYVDVMLAPARMLSLREPERRPRLFVPHEAAARARALLDRIGPYLVLNLASGSASREWPASSWREAIEALQRNSSVVLLSGGEVSAQATDLARDHRDVHTVATPSILDATAIMSHAYGIVTPDTSLVHVASALDLPTIGLYPALPENLARFAPLASWHVALTPHEGISVAGIRSTDVVHAVEHLLSAPPPHTDRP